MRACMMLVALIAPALACGASVSAQTTPSQPAPSPAAPPRPPACTDAAHRQFDFWLGGWDVYPAGSDKPVARSVIESVYGGCGVRENWLPLNGAGGGSLNNYDTPSGKWHQSWIDSSGTRVEFEGGLVDGKMVLTGTHKSGPNAGKGLLVRMTFTPLPSGWVRQFGEQSSDNGATWQAQYDFTYKPAL
ncbi:MAG: hypothetical protein J7485_02990 [Sphingobium sp.]|nr:hypothetical protein [Sphingobium sp.]